MCISSQKECQETKKENSKQKTTRPDSGMSRYKEQHGLVNCSATE